MADKQWIGGRPVIEYVNTITIAGTWVAGETLSVTIDGVSLTLTIGSTVDTSTVASNLKKAWEGEALDSGYEANILGTQSGRHYELIATVAAAVVTITERPFTSITEGKPFTSLSTSETSSLGTITLGTPNTPAGPYTFDNAANWKGGVVPADTDDLTIEGPYDIRYGIDQSAVLQTCTLRILGTFTGQFGLPRLRSITLPSGVVETFEEYRPTFWKSNSGGNITVEIGRGGGDGPTLVKIDANTATLAAKVFATGTPPVASEPAVFFAGVSGALYQYGGTVGINFYADDRATAMGSIHVTSPAGSTAGAILVVGESFPGVTTGVVNGGIATLHHTMGSGETWECTDGGTINFRGVFVSDGAFKAYGGTINLDPNGGTLGTVAIAVGSPGFFGSIVIAGGLPTITITNCTIYSAGYTLRVAGRRTVTWTNDIILAAGVRLTDGVIDIPPSAGSYKIQHTALA